MKLKHLLILGGLLLAGIRECPPAESLILLEPPTKQESPAKLDGSSIFSGIEEANRSSSRTIYGYSDGNTTIYLTPQGPAYQYDRRR